MIQRIQSLYLLFVVVLGTVYCFLPSLDFFDFGSNEITHLYLFPLVSWQKIPLLVITIIIPLLALIILFSFRNRMWQIRLSIVNIVLCLGYYAILASYHYFMLYPSGSEIIIEGNKCLPTPWAALPLVCLIFTVMAMVKIIRDEALVKASERLR